MDKAIGLAVLAAGMILIAYGAHFADSIAAGMARMFTGQPAGAASWFFVGGIIAAVGGGAVVFLPFRKN